MLPSGGACRVRQALQTLFDTKQKAKVSMSQGRAWQAQQDGADGGWLVSLCQFAPRQEEIKATAAKRSTQVLQELPKKIQDAEKLRTDVVAATFHLLVHSWLFALSRGVHSTCEDVGRCKRGHAIVARQMLVGLGLDSGPNLEKVLEGVWFRLRELDVVSSQVPLSRASSHAASMPYFQCCVVAFLQSLH